MNVLLAVYTDYRYIGRHMTSETFRRPTYFILAALLEGPLHGYGIIKRVEELANGELHLRAGTLYAALDRLADQGLVIADREEVVSGRLRRYYRLTPEGVTALTAEAAQLRRAADVVMTGATQTLATGTT
jgi:PadR family transcriptional regulator, regulatory protein PadR